MVRARKCRSRWRLSAVEALEPRCLLAAAAWAGYAANAQHTALSANAAQDLDQIVWHAPVDDAPQYNGNDLFIHYGSPLVTAANTVIIPEKTGATGGFQLRAVYGSTGATKWQQTTDYILPPHDWTPSYSPTLTPAGRLYFAGAGGTVYYLDAPDATGATTTGQIAFYGLANYLSDKSTYDGTVFIDTPVTADSAGNIYFGFVVTGANAADLDSGFARIDASGKGTWIAASDATGDRLITQPVMNAAPALSSDGKTLYVVASHGNFSYGDLIGLDSTTLAPLAGENVRLTDPNGNDATLPDDGTASPTIGPDGDVYFGVLEYPFPYNHDRGWLLHFSADLSQAKATGAFGWDDTASIVPATMVPSYHGTSAYLLLTKYNNYAGAGGDGVNKLAILDPHATMVDPVSGATVMREVLTIAGVTPDPEFDSTFPNAVREWCINTAAVDPQTDSVIVNSEDGTLYRWDLSTNAFTQRIVLTSGIGEAYTPTAIGADGKVYAISNATLYAVGQTAGASPAAANVLFLGIEDHPLTIPPSQFLAAASGGNGNPLSVVLSPSLVPLHGTVTVNPSGNFVYSPAADFNGSDQFGYAVTDGQTTSAFATVSINLTAVNDPPSFLVGPAEQVTDEDGPQAIPNWATKISAGPPDEAAQTLSFRVTSDNPGFFAAVPAIDASGNLTFAPAPNAAATVTVTVVLQDSGGKALGGNDSSQSQTFTIHIAKLHPQHNAAKPLDVDADTLISAHDALTIINYLNDPGHSSVVGPDTGTAPYYDVDADGFVAPIDALLIINALNAKSAAGEGETAAAPLAALLPDRSGGSLLPSDLIDLVTFDVASVHGRRLS